MKKLPVCAVFMAGVLAISLSGGCEGNPDTENVNNYFDGNPAAAATRPAPAGSAQMRIAPSEVALTNYNGEATLFKVEGASGAVAWSVQDISKGSILTQSNTEATYQRAASGDNVVIATDSRGNAAFATVFQP